MSEYHPPSQSSLPQNEPPPPQRDNFWVETAKTLALSFVLALGTRAYVAEARYIPSGSMLPTLEINDRLIIDKVSYRFGEPQRGDIVVFSPPEVLEQQNFHDALIKRVIGLPGEKIEVRDGQVFVNDQALSENYTQEAATYELQPVEVPADHYLVLGDNRNNSSDSHVWGFVPEEKLIGRAMVRYWPLSRFGEVSPQPPYRQAN